MSEVFKRLKDVEGQQVMTQALKKSDDAGNKRPPNVPIGSEDEPDKKPSLAILMLFFLLIVTMGVVVFFSVRTINKMIEVQRASDQIQVLLEEHMEEYNELHAYVKAVEFEFRGAFKKDRGDMKGLQEALLEQYAELDQRMLDFSEQITKNVLSYKTDVTDNAAEMSRIKRNYDELMVQFKEIQREMKSLRERVLAVTTPTLESSSALEP